MKHVTRSLLCIVACASLLISAGFRETAPAYERARHALDHHNYQVRFSDQHVGRLRSGMSIDRAGRVVAESDFLTRLASEHNSRQHKRFEFAARVPHDLLSATLISEREGTRVTTTLIREDQKYVARIDGHQAARETPWSFTLADYLGVELWLQSEPEPGNELIGQDLDFAALRPTAQVWRLLELNETGHLLGTGALRTATTIQMDADLVPVEFNILDAISVIAVDENAPLPDLASGMHSRFFHVPLDEKLGNHTAIRQLRLAVVAPPALHRAWPLIDPDGVIRSGVAGERQTATTLDPDSQIGSNSDYPTHSEALREVAQALLAQWRTDDQAQQLRELLTFVNTTLTYEHSAAYDPSRANARRWPR